MATSEIYPYINTPGLVAGKGRRMGVLWNPTIVNGAFPFIFPLPCQVLTINGHLPSTTICSS